MKTIIVTAFLFITIGGFAQNANPVFPKRPQIAKAEIGGTTTDLSGRTTTNLKTLYTGGANGSKVTSITAKADTVTQAGMFLIFLTDSGGANPRLFDQITISAVTPSTSVQTFRQQNIYSDLNLQSGQSILVGVTTLTGTRFQAWASIGDF